MYTVLCLTLHDEHWCVSLCWRSATRHTTPTCLCHYQWLIRLLAVTSQLQLCCCGTSTHSRLCHWFSFWLVSDSFSLLNWKETSYYNHMLHIYDVHLQMKYQTSNSPLTTDCLIFLVKYDNSRWHKKPPADQNQEATWLMLTFSTYECCYSIVGVYDSTWI